MVTFLRGVRLIETFYCYEICAVTACGNAVLAWCLLDIAPRKAGPGPDSFCIYSYNFIPSRRIVIGLDGVYITRIVYRFILCILVPEVRKGVWEHKDYGNVVFVQYT